MDDSKFNSKNDFKKSNNMAVNEQLSLFVQTKNEQRPDSSLQNLTRLLKSDLNFHNHLSNIGSHNFHSFPAKFPPQLPKFFIENLTKPNDLILDPMVGSGTTIVEAYRLNRKSIGFDIDPLAIKIARAKTSYLEKRTLIKYCSRIYTRAKEDYIQHRNELIHLLNSKFDRKTKEFIDYWFWAETQLELLALLKQIQNIENEDYKIFFEVVFSSIIITKSGGVSLALDLGHTRPHKVKALLDNHGHVIYGDRNFDISKKRFVAKTLRPSFEEFLKKCDQNIHSIIKGKIDFKPEIKFGDSQKLDLDDESVDLVVTSPPYASNAIDYMRAHKFSLVWFGHKIDELSKLRNEYIGAEGVKDYSFEALPEFTSQKINEVYKVDPKRGRVLHRYFSEMKKSIKEMYRVLKPGKAAIVIVGNSTMRGVDTETHRCLKDIGSAIGFVVPQIGVRHLDRNRRMLPMSSNINHNSQIQKRMNKEYVIGFYKF